MLRLYLNGSAAVTVGSMLLSHGCGLFEDVQQFYDLHYCLMAVGLSHTPWVAVGSMLLSCGWGSFQEVVHIMIC